MANSNPSVYSVLVILICVSVFYSAAQWETPSSNERELFVSCQD